MNKVPIPGFDLAPAALFALADSNSVPDRTAFRGGVSFFEVLVLAPGMQYQQSADAVCGLFSHFPEAFETAQPAIASEGDTPRPAITRRWPVHNRATLRFLSRVVQSGDFPCSLAPLTTTRVVAGPGLQDSILVGCNSVTSVRRVWTFDVGLEVWPEMVPYTS